MHYYRRMPSDCPSRTIDEVYTGIHKGDVVQGNPKSKCAFEARRARCAFCCETLLTVCQLWETSDDAVRAGK